MQTLRYADLQHRHTLAAPATARELVLIEHQEEWQTARPGNIVLGGGSNIIFCGEVQERLLHPVYRGYEVIAEDREQVFLQVQAGQSWQEVVRFTCAQGWYGAENLALIPGTAGAAPVQNIGAYGVELQQILHSIRVYDRDNRSFTDISARQGGFAYRYSHFKGQWRNRYLISALTLKLSKRGQLHTAYPGLAENAATLHTPSEVLTAVETIRRAKLPDPAKLPNAGSFFHNPVIAKNRFADLHKRFPDMPYFPTGENVKIPAAWCIEQCGFKGKFTDKVGIYEKHALILINHGATGAEILAFAATIQQAVMRRFALQLHIEPTICGEPYECKH